MLLQEARGQALIRLKRPAEAAEALLALFGQRRTASIYLALREAAGSVGRWDALFPQLRDQLQAEVLTDTQRESHSTDKLFAASLLGFAYLFEHYYQGLFATYRRYPALKDELRKAVE